MKTNEKKYLQKKKRIEQKLAKIEQKNPGFNFKDLPLINDIDEHRKLTKQLIFTNVDIIGCKEQKFKCENCICK